MPDIDPTTFAQRFPEISRALPPDEIQAIIEVASVEDIGAGETLVAEGEDSDALFFVVDGDIDITLNTAEGERSVASGRPGTIFGEVSLLDPGAATASVKAVGDCRVLRVDHVALDHLLDTSPAAAADLMVVLTTTLASRVEAAMDSLDDHVANRDTGVDALVDVEHLLYEKDA